MVLLAWTAKRFATAGGAAASRHVFLGAGSWVRMEGNARSGTEQRPMRFWLVLHESSARKKLFVMTLARLMHLISLTQGSLVAVALVLIGRYRVLRLASG